VLLEIPDLTPLDTGKPLVLGERPEETTKVTGLEDTTMGEFWVSCVCCVCCVRCVCCD